jgi:hypothetical protein
MEAWAAGLIGAVIGALSSFGGIWIQSRNQHRREMAKIVMETAAQDRQTQIDLATKKGASGPIPPVILYAHYHAELLKLISSGRLTNKRLEKLHSDNREMWLLIQALDKKHNPD